MPPGPLAPLCAQVPVAGHGYQAWPAVRLVIELATIANSPARWDSARWDSAQWGTTQQWTDITARGVRVTLTRGRTAPGDRYRVAGGAVLLDNADGALDPWATTGPFTSGGVSTIRPGALIRCGVQTPSGWHPWFTGGVEAWAETITPAGVPTMTATVSDTFTDLSAIDNGARAAAGAGETAGARLDRLITDAAWRFGTQLDAGVITCQATTMAGNRLSECYLVTDSDGGLFYALGDGTARFHQFQAHPAVHHGTVTDYPTTGAVPYATITPACDWSRILNVANVSAAGGTVHTATDPASMFAFGARSSGLGFPRLDLIHQAEAHSQQLADAAVARFANDVLRVDAITLVADQDPALPAFMGELVIGGTVDVRRLVNAAETTVRYRVASLDYALVPAGPTPVFTQTVALEAP